MARETIVGLWKNQYGSVLEFTEENAGNLIGRFMTRVGRQETKDVWNERWFKVIGTWHNELIAFVVSYCESGALATHVGKICHENGSVALKVKGLFFQDLPHDQEWRETVVTSSEFRKIS